VKAQIPKTILVIDDEPSVTGALSVILREAGYEVLIADRVA
jgi:DNA-binding response OmpR family regulator